MDAFLVTVTLIMIAWLLYSGVTEWRKTTQEQKVFMIETLVAAAQQLYGKDPGTLRFDWVVQRVKERWPNTDEKELEELIEAAVYRLRVFAGITKGETEEQQALYWMGSGRHN